jgi:hypothetical protein
MISSACRVMSRVLGSLCSPVILNSLAQAAVRSWPYVVFDLRPKTFRDECEQLCLFFGRRGTHSRELNPVELDVGERPRYVFVKVEIRLGLAVERAWCSLDEGRMLTDLP